MEHTVAAVSDVDESGEKGWIHSYESGSRVDGPETRLTIFLQGCLLRCQYCHNPDTWHIKEGQQVSAADVIARIKPFAAPLKMMGGGVTLSGGEPLVQKPFVEKILRGAKALGLHTALDTAGFLGAKADDAFLDLVDLVLLDIKSWDPALYQSLTGVALQPTLAFAQRLQALNKKVWIRFVLVPGLTDSVENVAGLAKFLAPMKNIEWVEVLPFHQLGAFKYKERNMPYALENTPTPSPELIERVLEQFRAEGLNAR